MEHHNVSDAWRGCGIEQNGDELANAQGRSHRGGRHAVSLDHGLPLSKMSLGSTIAFSRFLAAPDLSSADPVQGLGAGRTYPPCLALVFSRARRVRVVGTTRARFAPRYRRFCDLVLQDLGDGEQQVNRGESATDEPAARSSSTAIAGSLSQLGSWVQPSGCILTKPTLVSDCADIRQKLLFRSADSRRADV